MFKTHMNWIYFDPQLKRFKWYAPSQLSFNSCSEFRIQVASLPATREKIKCAICVHYHLNASTILVAMAFLLYWGATQILLTPQTALSGVRLQLQLARPANESSEAQESLDAAAWRR